MARPVGGEECVEEAYKAIINAKSVQELRQAQAVVFPLELGLDMRECSRYLGISVRWTCTLRNHFIHGKRIGLERAKRRPNANMTLEEEKAFLSPFFEGAATGSILVVGEIHQALQEKLGRKVSLSSTYNLLHRHNWRKLAPDKCHPQSDPVAQENWKKNYPTSSEKSRKTGREKQSSR